MLPPSALFREQLPTYMNMLNTLDGVRDETGASMTPWAQWTRKWTAEENRHGDAMNKCALYVLPSLLSAIWAAGLVSLEVPTLLQGNHWAAKMSAQLSLRFVIRATASSLCVLGACCVELVTSVAWPCNYLSSRYLWLTGRVNMRAVEVTIQNLIGSGMDPKTENNPYLGFIYTSFQERATKVRKHDALHLG